MNITGMQIDEFLARYETAANSHDFARVAPLIHPNATFRFTDGDHQGIDAIRAAIESTWSASDVKDERYVLTDIKI
ncbi:MAG: nuclear transport factor 2 family protein, partial [Dehalococcoidia bacterium]